MRQPISQEGFSKLITDVMDELNDIELEHAVERLGLPPEAVYAFARRMTATMDTADHDRNVKEALVIGALIGAKVNEWRTRASTN